MREAKEMDTRRAGPNAVWPPSSSLQTATKNNNHKLGHPWESHTFSFSSYSSPPGETYSKIFLLRVLLDFSTGAGREMSSPAFMIASRLLSLSPASVTTPPDPSPITVTCKDQAMLYHSDEKVGVATLTSLLKVTRATRCDG